MENMDKGLNVPEWLLIVRRKIPYYAPEFISPICLPIQKFSISIKKAASLGVRSPCMGDIPVKIHMLLYKLRIFDENILH